MQKAKEQISMIIFAYIKMDGLRVVTLQILIMRILDDTIEILRRR